MCVRAAPRSTWFQAYLPGDPAKIDAMVQRVQSAGYRTLVLTVDVATLPSRENNIRVGFTMPLRPSVRLAWDGIVRPRWTIGTLLRTLLKNGMPHFENSSATRGVPIFSSAAVREFGSRDTLSWTHVDQIRRMWNGKLVLKGSLIGGRRTHRRRSWRRWRDRFEPRRASARRVDCAAARAAGDRARQRAR